MKIELAFYFQNMPAIFKLPQARFTKMRSNRKVHTHVCNNNSKSSFSYTHVLSNYISAVKSEEYYAWWTQVIYIFLGLNYWFPQLRIGLIKAPHFLSRSIQNRWQLKPDKPVVAEIHHLSQTGSKAVLYRISEMKAETHKHKSKIQMLMHHKEDAKTIRQTNVLHFSDSSLVH